MISPITQKDVPFPFKLLTYSSKKGDASPEATTVPAQRAFSMLRLSLTGGSLSSWKGPQDTRLPTAVPKGHTGHTHPALPRPGRDGGPAQGRWLGQVRQAEPADYSPGVGTVCSEAGRRPGGVDLPRIDPSASEVGAPRPRLAQSDRPTETCPHVSAGFRHVHTLPDGSPRSLLTLVNVPTKLWMSMSGSSA